MRSEFLKITATQRGNMVQRFKPRYKDDGVTLRKAGRRVPFSLAEFREWFHLLLSSERGLRCWYCDKRLKLGTVTIDHIMPVHRGGNLDLGNLAPACKPCNLRKGNRTAEVYRSLLAFLETVPEYDRNSILKDLGSAAMGSRLRFFPRKDAEGQPIITRGPGARPARISPVSRYREPAKPKTPSLFLADSDF